MTSHALMMVDKETFARFVAKADRGYRYEWVRAWIMQRQAGGTRRHAILAASILKALDRALEPASYTVLGSDLAIDTGDAIRYADVVVERRGAGPGESLTTAEPVVIVEVLSPSSEERDLGAKPADYLALRSLEAYIVAHQDAARCYLWRRDGAGSFAATPTTIEGLDGAIEVPALNLRLLLAAIYGGADIAAVNEDE